MVALVLIGLVIVAGTLLLMPYVAPALNLFNRWSHRRARPALGSPLSKPRAEDLLDWLQNHGYDGCEVSCPDQRSYVVRLKPDSK